jgi:hypothetical protein
MGFILKLKDYLCLPTRVRKYGGVQASIPQYVAHFVIFNSGKNQAKSEKIRQNRKTSGKIGKLQAS